MSNKQTLTEFLENDVSIWMDDAANALNELADLLRTIDDQAEGIGSGRIKSLSKLGIRVAQDAAGGIGCCFDDLHEKYLNRHNGGAA